MIPITKITESMTKLFSIVPALVPRGEQERNWSKGASSFAVFWKTKKLQNHFTLVYSHSFIVSPHCASSFSSSPLFLTSCPSWTSWFSLLSSLCGLCASARGSSFLRVLRELRGSLFFLFSAFSASLRLCGRFFFSLCSSWFPLFPHSNKTKSRSSRWWLVLSASMPPPFSADRPAVRFFPPAPRGPPFQKKPSPQ